MAQSVTSRQVRRRTFKNAQHRQQQINRFGRIPDKLWAVFLLYLPREPRSDRRGRPSVPFRKVLGGILYRLRTGCQWKAIPAEFGSGSTCHRRFQEWQQLGLFEKVWAHQLHVYDQKRGIGWNWQSLDSAIIPAPLGGTKTGKNPVDRAKSGSKRNVLVDRRGVPLALTIAAANKQDYQCADELLHHLVIRRSWLDRAGRRAVLHLCGDKGYDFDEVYQVARRLGYRVHIGHRRRRGEPESSPIKGRRHPARRWVIERTNSWHNRYRALKIRWEKKMRITRRSLSLPVRLSPHDF
jgi:putative transposase